MHVREGFYYLSVILDAAYFVQTIILWFCKYFLAEELYGEFYKTYYKFLLKLMV